MLEHIKQKAIINAMHMDLKPEIQIQIMAM
jgi:hypothetical protein